MKFFSVEICRGSVEICEVDVDFYTKMQMDEDNEFLEREKSVELNGQQIWFFACGEEEMMVKTEDNWTVDLLKERFDQLEDLMSDC